MRDVVILAATLILTIGCHTNVRQTPGASVAVCKASDSSEALSYHYETCLRKQLRAMSHPQINAAHSALPIHTREYLSRRIHTILGTQSADKDCLNILPNAYCELLSARNFEQLGSLSKAHQVYQVLIANKTLPHTALAGLIRTENQPDTAIPDSAQKHPDYLAATCAQMIKHAPNDVFTQVVTECLDKTPRSSAVLSELARREWSFGLRLKAIRRLENHLQSDALDHRIRGQLALYLFEHEAFIAAIDHTKQLIRYRSATPLQMKNMIFALIRTSNYSSAQRYLDDTSSPLGQVAKDTLLIHLSAHQGQCEALDENRWFEIGEHQTLNRVLSRLNLLSQTPCEFLTESVLINVLRQAPENPTAWVHLIEYYTASGQHDLASKTLSETLPKFPTTQSLYHLAAQIHQAKGHLELASDQIRRARVLEPDNLEYRTFDTELTFRMGQFAEAIKLMTNLVHIDPSNLEIAKKLALTKLLMNDLEHAVELLRWLTDIQPDDEVLKLQYATTLVRLNRPIGAKKALQDTVRVKPEYGDAWALLAITHAGLDELPEANKAFRQALRLSPSHRHLRLAYARFLESQRQYTEAQRQYERLLARSPKDEEAKDSMRRMNRSETSLPSNFNRALNIVSTLNPAHFPFLNGLDSPAIVINDQRDVEIKSDGDLDIEIFRTILIKDASAISRFSTVEIPYDTSFPPEVNEAVVISPEGRLTPIDSKHWTHLNPNRHSPMFGDARTLRIQFPNLESGSILRYRIRTRLPKKPETMVWWDSYVLGNEVFTLSAAYSIRIPPTHTYTVTGVGLTEESVEQQSGMVHRRWTANLVPSFAVLSRTQQPLPMIYLSSFETWSDVDRWYTKLFAPATTLGPTLREVAQSISTRIQGTDARVAAVVEAVEQRIDYEGVEYGIGAYLPRPAESTWLRAKGDCKDMVALIVGLLKHMNIEAHPVLIRPRDAGPFMVHYPSPSQFSHVIVMVKGEQDNLFWIDPTARMHTLDALPALVRGAPAFVVNAQGGLVTETPSAIKDKNIVRQTSVIEISDDSQAHIQSNLRLNGDAAGWGRLYVRAQSESKRNLHLFLPGLMLGDQVIPTTVNVTNLKQSNLPLNIDTEGHIEVTADPESRRTFKGILDPTASSFIALLNSAEQINAPRDFRKVTTFKFRSPHTLKTNLERLNLSGPIKLVVNRTGSNLDHRIEVSLKINHALVLQLNESEFMESLRKAQSIMERPLTFVKDET